MVLFLILIEDLDIQPSDINSMHHIDKSLTSLWTAKLKDAKDEYGFNKIWTSDSGIMVMEKEPTKPELLYG